MLDALFGREIDPSCISWFEEVMGNYKKMEMVLMCLFVAGISTLFAQDRIPGDINSDGAVDFEDFLILADNYGKSGLAPVSETVTDTVVSTIVDTLYKDAALVVEVHQSHTGTNLWYHVGILDANGLSIDWGESHRYDQGRSPKCALDGTTIVEVHQGHNDTDLWYRVGTVDIPSRTIAWQPSHQYDRGNIPSVAINGNTVIETHQSHEGENLWFKVGKLQRVTGTISWGPSNNYGNGKIPNIGF